MQQATNLGRAFAFGLAVAEGRLTDERAREWIDSVISFHEAHPDADSTVDPSAIGELRGALERAYDAGRSSGIPIPLNSGEQKVST